MRQLFLIVQQNSTSSDLVDKAPPPGFQWIAGLCLPGGYPFPAIMN